MDTIMAALALQVAVQIGFTCLWCALAIIPQARGLCPRMLMVQKHAPSLCCFEAVMGLAVRLLALLSRLFKELDRFLPAHLLALVLKAPSECRCLLQAVSPCMSTTLQPLQCATSVRYIAVKDCVLQNFCQKRNTTNFGKLSA